MKNPDPINLSAFGQQLLDRRKFLKDTASLMGSFSLMSLLQNDGLLGSDVAGQSSDKTPIRPIIDPKNPYAAREPHFDASAKKLLIIFCAGAVSHIDTFDYKPELFKYHGMRAPGQPAVTFEGPSGNIHKPFWDFSPQGQTGKMISNLLPNLGSMVDDYCFFHALHSGTSAHPTAENFMSTGFTFEGFPSIGSWVSYALGTENQELPAYVAINDPRGMPRSAKNNWGNGFLPASFQGTNFSAAEPVPNIATPDSIGSSRNKKTIDAIERMNAKHLDQFPGDSELAARIASYELAGRMQMSIPDLTDIDGEPDYVLKEYGADSSNELKSAYAKNCILARRMIEKGVRCVQLFNGSDASGGNGVTNWDSHSKIHETHGMQADIMDQPTAALLADMKRRGLLDDTLVVWCTEFGRMPFLQASNGSGRDHNAGAFTSFMMGAGVKKGYAHGESDEFGYKGAKDKTSVYDFNATILHLLGLDHERLSFYNNGLERRLTNVHGHVVKDVLA